MTDEHLSHIERRLLRLLVNTPGRIVPHAELLRDGWSYEFDGIAERHVLRQTLSRLRKKLGPDMEIENHPRRGYRLCIVGAKGAPPGRRGPALCNET